jgi:hypothetical protein
MTDIQFEGEAFKGMDAVFFMTFSLPESSQDLGAIALHAP